MMIQSRIRPLNVKKQIWFDRATLTIGWEENEEDS
jgi:hypothetical protein